MFKSSAYGLLIAAVLSTQVLAGSASVGSQSTGTGAGKITFNPFAVAHRNAGGRTVPLGMATPKAPGPAPDRHFTLGGVTGATFAPHCVAPLVAIAYCIRRGPGAHGKCQEIVWRCQLPGVSQVDPARR